MSYAAFANYGDVAQQALKIFRQELQESAVLRDWWQHGDMATAGPKIEDSVEKMAQLQQFLGEEIVVSGSLEGQDPKLLSVAEIRKPGLKKFLQETITQLGGESKQRVHVLDQQDLATAKDEGLPKLKRSTTRRRETLRTRKRPTAPTIGSLIFKGCQPRRTHR